MDTTTKKTDTVDLEKQAARLSKLILPLSTLSKESLMAYLTLAAGIGAAGGAGLGAAASYVKSKDPKLIALSRKKEFYDKKIEEMENENWLNDIMDAKRKLDSSRLTDEERSDLEKKYVKLLNK
jgi:hypothetical protein